MTNETKAKKCYLCGNERELFHYVGKEICSACITEQEYYRTQQRHGEPPMDDEVCNYD